MNETRLKTVIVDDESSGRNILQLLLERNCPDVQVVGTCSSVDEAVTIINQAGPDLIFLDIEMPGRNGFDLLNCFDSIDFHVVFVTAYNKPAIQAIKMNALDYLLKPVRIEDLTTIVNKVLNAPPNVNNLVLAHFRDNYNKLDGLVIPTSDGFLFANLADVVRCESSDKYSLIHRASGTPAMSTKSLAEYDEILGNLGFVRIHKSHLINQRYVKKYVKGDNAVVRMVDGAEIPVSIRKQEEFLFSNPFESK